LPSSMRMIITELPVLPNSRDFLATASSVRICRWSAIAWRRRFPSMAPSLAESAVRMNGVIFSILRSARPLPGSPRESLPRAISRASHRRGTNLDEFLGTSCRISSRSWNDCSRSFWRTREESQGRVYLPAAVSSLLATGEATVRLLHSGDPWLGLTYSEDRPLVAKALESAESELIGLDSLRS